MNIQKKKKQIMLPSSKNIELWYLKDYVEDLGVETQVENLRIKFNL